MCPSCKRKVLPRSANPMFPFCSARCRAVDLGRWLGEEYRVAGPPADRSDDEEDPLPAREPGDGPDA